MHKAMDGGTDKDVCYRTVTFMLDISMAISTFSQMPHIWCKQLETVSCTQGVTNVPGTCGMRGSLCYGDMRHKCIIKMWKTA